MLFNSLPFLFSFLPLVILMFYACCFLNSHTLARLALLFASLFFYAYWDARFLPLLIISICFNFLIGKLICFYEETILASLCLFTGLIGNISFLAYCKYLNFFVSSLNSISSTNLILEEIILPLGISFFTFTQIAYLVDIYQQKTIPSEFISYGLFVTIFPHLIAGPILHHKEMLYQFDSPETFRWQTINFAEGWFLFVIGLAKKVLIADNLALIVKPIFDDQIDSVPFIQAWVGAISYSLQLYFDFSGYSDMAIGLGLLFNIRLPLNFNSPYQANSIIDFWRRWHITLSNFLRDYLYIPLGGNKFGEFSKLRNLLLTMVLGGLWHGAGWTYILWGCCHGIFLVINHLWRKLNISLFTWLDKTLTLLAVVGAWVIFRATSIEIAANILSGMVGLNGFILPTSYLSRMPYLKTLGIDFIDLDYSHFHLWHLLVLVGLVIATLKLPNSLFWKNIFTRKPVLLGVTCGFLFLLILSQMSKSSEFLYYQF